ncbi:multidrug ABC transporter ATP-binding protein [Microbacterium testaceum]|uniref:ATP-binding cassette domain-containing protein n=1 Tax=Microbacterium testaceum TaxID=2033 RepID=UPI000734F1EA|nr:ATP-binding cassette domain-containing protein [Microbacterium testaceum]KTS87282.1 multidrug ABC transporter ATP-binding protein [Microbacterium testaceum]
MTLSVKNLSKRYGKTFAVKNVSFEIAPGKVTGFLGPNGAGKSTTLRSIVGLDFPTSGEALIDGRRYAELKAPLHEVGTLLDAKAAHRSRRAVDHLRWIAATHGIRRARIDEVLDIAGLTTVARKRVGGFSLGMAQRLGIAAALLGDPHTLILDEPVNGLDPDGVTWIRELLRGFAAEGRTVFLSSHLLGELSLIAEHIVVIGQGRIIADAPLTALIQTSPTVRVRTAEAARLAELVAGPGVAATMPAPDRLEIDGLPVEQIAEIAARERIVVYEMGQLTRKLEDAYNDLTRGAVEYAPQQAGEPHRV